MNAGISKFSNNGDIFLSRFLGLLLSDKFSITFFGHSGLAFAAISGIFIKFFTLKNKKNSNLGPDHLLPLSIYK